MTDAPVEGFFCHSDSCLPAKPHPLLYPHICMIRNSDSWFRLFILFHAVFSLWIWSNYIPLFFFADKYWSTRQNFGQEYIDALTKLMPMWMCPVHLVLCFVFGIVGGLLGRKILKKHFIKAGIV